MAQANPDNSTPMAVDSTRRRFLSQAAGVAAGGTALALASLPARAADDPVFGLIETHRAAHAALVAAIYQDFDGDGATAAHEVEQSALVDLIEAAPTTLAGVIATMRYIADVGTGDEGYLLPDEINPLLANLAKALERLAVQS
jgi:hypothetical protein